jgi:transglutaminase-like putative cysteine protease
MQKWTSSDAQKWKPVYAESGWFYLRSRSGAYLCATGSASGAGVVAVAGEDAPAKHGAKLMFRLRVASAYSTTGIASLDARVDKILAKTGRGKGALKKAFNHVAYKFRYRSGSKYPKGNWGPRLALEMAKRKSGNCYRFAALFYVLAKELGYTAKVVSGAVPSRSGGWAAHGWVEIRKGGKTYLCDPDMANAIRGRRWYMVTYANAPLSYRKS